MGRAPRKNDHDRAKRGAVMGWSKDAARRNMVFLMSVKTASLTGVGYAVTFTVRDCPESSDHWKRLREALFKRFERLGGFLRGHWVTEWQRRGVPHMHGLFYFDREGLGEKLIEAWLDVSAEFGSGRKGQTFRVVDDTVGWFRYLAKHASRGYKHYQRAGENVPEGWRITGRVWGYIGDWDVAKPREYHVDDPAFFYIRRVAKGWAKADARTVYQRVFWQLIRGETVRAGVWKEARNRITFTRHMWRNPDPLFSRLQGVRDWFPQEIMNALIEWMAGSGFIVEKVPDSGQFITVDGMLVDPDTGEIIE